MSQRVEVMQIPDEGGKSFNALVMVSSRWPSRDHNQSYTVNKNWGDEWYNGAIIQKLCLFWDFEISILEQKETMGVQHIRTSGKGGPRGEHEVGGGEGNGRTARQFLITDKLHADGWDMAGLWDGTWAEANRQGEEGGQGGDDPEDNIGHCLVGGHLAVHKSVGSRDTVGDNHNWFWAKYKLYWWGKIYNQGFRYQKISTVPGLLYSSWRTGCTTHEKWITPPYKRYKSAINMCTL